MNMHRDHFERKHVEIGKDLSLYTRISTDPLPADASAVVLVHGLSVSSGYMVPTAVRLAAHYHVYVPDLPGFGRSSKPRQIFNVAELADVLADWMNRIGLRSATFLGNSMGCQTIVNLALRHPELVERAVLVSPTMDPDALTIHQEAWRLLRDAKYEPFHFLPVMAREYLIAGVRRTICTLRYAFEDPMQENLKRVQVPVLLVRGSEDPIVPQDWVEQVDKLLPKSRLVVIQKAGHAVNFNSPDELVQHVCDFIEHKSEVEQVG
jgi:2-hydroxy-6-oxonona-2,4-dienedioate hydrolase